jgi:cell division protein FtsL
MDMANYNNEAYDLSQFAPVSAEITSFAGKKAEKAERRQARLQQIINTAAVVLVAAFVVGVLAMFLSLRAQLTEMNNAITQTEIRYNQVLGETKRLEGELAGLTSAQSVEIYAENAGLRQMESGQIDYITVTPVTPEAEDGGSFWESLWEGLTGWIG